jgi:arylsulfatase A-like enzyme
MPRPNIAFIIIDSARFDHFGLYGHDRKTTPFLDSIKADLTVYTNANTPASYTRPAMNSIFTGLYPQQYGFFESRFPDKQGPLLTTILKNNGYRVTMLSNNPYVSPTEGFDHGTDDFFFVHGGRFPRQLDRGVVLRNAVGLIKQRARKHTSYKIVPKMLNDQALAILNRSARASEPFFIYIHHDAHHPYLSERRYVRRFLGTDYTEDEIRLVERVQRSGNMWWFNRESLPQEQKERYYHILGAMHDASIYKNDLMIAELFEVLRRNRLYDEMMVVIAADHGEFLGERDLVSHGLYPYEESVRVPLLIKYPQHAGKSGYKDRLTSTIDIMPTILHLAGLEARSFIPEVQGMSLLDEAEHEFVVTQRRNFWKGLELWQKNYPDHSFEKYDYGNLLSMKTRTSKFVWSSKGKHGLFDLVSDPGETRNTYGDDEGSRTWLARCTEWMETVPKVEGKGPGEFDEIVQKHLRGLGYID